MKLAGAWIGFVVTMGDYTRNKGATGRYEDMAEWYVAVWYSAKKVQIQWYRDWSGTLVAADSIYCVFSASDYSIII